ncbi:uncharacterized protein LOC121389515 isoform X2 [Gigantopelta aegis]|nr:uncharacterized protein LOC121389515 isoform X2 [Gigantopelta aegis]
MTIVISGLQCRQNATTTIECNTGCCGDPPAQHCCVDRIKETMIAIAVFIASIVGLAVIGTVICVCMWRFFNKKDRRKLENDHGKTCNIVTMFAGEIQEITPLIKFDPLSPRMSQWPYTIHHLPIPHDPIGHPKNGDVINGNAPNIPTKNEGSLGYITNRDFTSSPKDSVHTSDRVTTPTWAVTVSPSKGSTGYKNSLRESKQSEYDGVKRHAAPRSNKVFYTPDNNKEAKRAWTSPDLSSRSQLSTKKNKKHGRKVKFDDRMLKTN